MSFSLASPPLRHSLMCILGLRPAFDRLFGGCESRRPRPNLRLPLIHFHLASRFGCQYVLECLAESIWQAIPLYVYP